jgi:M-phase inducer tyrosine phosphatase
MDDPAYQRARATDLNDFRRWNRARSFTYGEQRAGPPVTSQEAPTEGTRPVSTDTGTNGKVGLSFAAAKAAFGRRGGERASNGVSGGLSTLQEDGDSSCASETDVGDSPCPPSNRTSLTIMGATKPRGMQRAMTTALSNTRR